MSFVIEKKGSSMADYRDHAAEALAEEARDKRAWEKFEEHVAELEEVGVTRDIAEVLSRQLLVRTDANFRSTWLRHVHAQESA